MYIKDKSSLKIKLSHELNENTNLLVISFKRFGKYIHLP